MAYKILHLPTGTFLYRRILDTNLWGSFYSEYELDHNNLNNELFTSYIDITGFEDLLMCLKTYNNKYMYFGDNNNNPAFFFNLKEHFELVKVEDGI